MNTELFENERRPPIPLRELATTMAQSENAPRELAKRFGVSEHTVYAWLGWYEEHDPQNDWFKYRRLEPFEKQHIAGLLRKGTKPSVIRATHGYWPTHIEVVKGMIERGEV